MNCPSELYTFQLQPVEKRLPAFPLQFLKVHGKDSDWVSLGFPGGSVVKNPPAIARDADSIHELGRSPREGNGNQIFLPGKSHGQRSLVGCSP